MSDIVTEEQLSQMQEESKSRHRNTKALVAKKNYAKERREAEWKKRRRIKELATFLNPCVMFINAQEGTRTTQPIKEFQKPKKPEPMPEIQKKITLVPATPKEIPEVFVRPPAVYSNIRSAYGLYNDMLEEQLREEKARKTG